MRRSPLPPDLEALDLLLVSHLHTDHFDPVATERLVKELLLVAPPPSCRQLRGFNRVRRLGRWERLTLE